MRRSIALSHFFCNGWEVSYGRKRERERELSLTRSVSHVIAHTAFTRAQCVPGWVDSGAVFVSGRLKQRPTSCLTVSAALHTVSHEAWPRPFAVSASVCSFFLSLFALTFCHIQTHWRAVLLRNARAQIDTAAASIAIDSANHFLFDCARQQCTRICRKAMWGKCLRDENRTKHQISAGAGFYNRRKKQGASGRGRQQEEYERRQAQIGSGGACGARRDGGGGGDRSG